MNFSVSRLLSGFIILAAVFLTGCAGQLKQMPDGNYLGVTTAGDSVDRSASFIGEYKKIRGPDGKDAFQLIKPGQLSVGNTVVGQGAIAAVGGTLPALIQLKAANDVAKRNQCADGANCGSVINVQSNSGSTSQSVNQTNSNVGVNLGCGSACAPKYAE